ncbi:hypothetical protein HMPREF0023_0451 [Acinetobacter sp. ATCC 27244]|nr:hypothetical protein HMPREF0023_0451 [Acinetobacter sp. ATCC 27244]
MKNIKPPSCFIPYSHKFSMIKYIFKWRKNTLYNYEKAYAKILKQYLMGLFQQLTII